MNMNRIFTRHPRIVVRWMDLIAVISHGDGM